jgi:hypothetical protein
MSADIIPFARPIAPTADEFDEARLDLAEEVATFALHRVGEVFGDRGHGMDIETTVALILAAQIIENERAAEDGAA